VNTGNQVPRRHGRGADVFQNFQIFKAFSAEMAGFRTMNRSRSSRVSGASKSSAKGSATAFLQYVQSLHLQSFELRKINLPLLGNDIPLNQHVDYMAFCPVTQSLNLAPSPENCPKKNMSVNIPNFW
jgi:hypothetical protein